MGCSLGVQHSVRGGPRREQQQQPKQEDFLFVRRKSIFNENIGTPHGGSGLTEINPDLRGDGNCPHSQENQFRLDSTTTVAILPADATSDKRAKDAESGAAASAEEETELEMMEMSTKVMPKFDADVQASKTSKDNLGSTACDVPLPDTTTASEALNLPAIVGQSTAPSRRQASGRSGVSLPSIGHPVENSESSVRSKALVSRVQSPQVHNIRMHMERQLVSNGVTGPSPLSHFPLVRSSRMRKSMSCNDAWLTEIFDEDLAESGRVLPVISEVDGAGENEAWSTSSSVDGGGMPVASVTACRARTPYRASASLSFWAMPSFVNPADKRLFDRSHSLDSLRLPAIPEDLVSPNFMQASRNEPPEEDGHLQATEGKQTYVNYPEFSPTDTEDPSVTSDYGIRMYITSVTELLDTGNIDPRDYSLLRNITIDPLSPLLVQCVDSSRGMDNGGDGNGGKSHFAAIEDRSLEGSSHEGNIRINNNSIHCATDGGSRNSGGFPQVLVGSKDSRVPSSSVDTG